MNVHTPTDTAVLLRERDGPIAILTLNRPGPRNSLSEALLIALSEAWSDIAADKTVRAVVLTANGPAFCAGHDMKEMTSRRSDADGGRAYFRTIMTTCSAMMQQIVNLPQPVIAAVQGVATAAGCQLVASCDLAVASSAAKFATPGVDIGLFCSTPMVALSRNVARKHAMEMLLTGRYGRGRARRRIGLVNRVVPAGEELKEAIALAQGNRLEVVLHAQDRQAGILPAGRDEPCRGLCLCFRGDDREHDGARRRGRHRRLHRQARSDLARQVGLARPLTTNNASLVFTPAAQQAQAERGSAKAYASRLEEGFPDTVTPELAAFIAEQDTAFLGTANAQGAPYIQHRGGPKGFIKVIDEHTLGFADYRGNRQYITLANLSENDRAYLFLLDPARKQRIKLWGRARVVENDAALVGATVRRRLQSQTRTRHPVHDRSLGRQLLAAHRHPLHRSRDCRGARQSADEDRRT